MKGSSSPGILVTPCSLRTSSQIRDRELSTALAPDCRQSDALLIFSYFLSQQKTEPLSLLQNYKYFYGIYDYDVLCLFIYR